MMLYAIVNQFLFLIKEKMNYRLNWFCTIKASFSFFRFKDAIKLPILIYGECQYWNKGRITFNLDSIERGVISIGKGNNLLNPQFGQTRINNNGEIIINGRIRIMPGLKCFVANEGVLTINDNLSLGYGARIAAHSKIEIGKNALISWEVQIMDSDLHYMHDDSNVYRNSKNILIGDGCWVSNHVSIMKGVVLPNETIVSSFSLVNKNFKEDGEYCILGGIPARLLKKGYHRVKKRTVEKNLDKLFSQNDLCHLNKDIIYE